MWLLFVLSLWFAWIFLKTIHIDRLADFSLCVAQVSSTKFGKTFAEIISKGHVIFAELSAKC